MSLFLWLLWGVTGIANGATPLPPTPFPLFLKAGYSTILEFEEAPSRVVLGDTQSFQVERLERSLIVKTVTVYASSNMFVYFKNQDTRLFVLTASEDAEPTYFKKFESLKVPARASETASVKTMNSLPRGGTISTYHFDSKKDYLTIDIAIKADSNSPLKPNWNLVRLTSQGRAIAPFKLWAERKIVQKDSTTKARFIFSKPNISRDLKGVNLVIPLIGDSHSISIPLKGVSS